jgi:hypothetical protein
MYCLRYDFSNEWSLFVGGSGNFTVTLQKDYFPYAVQNARNLVIDAVTLFADVGGQVNSHSLPQSVVDSATLSSGLSAPGGAAVLSLPSVDIAAVLSLPSGYVFTTRDLSRQVFLVLQYHFGL